MLDKNDLQTIDDNVKVIKIWLGKQPHLPQNVDDLLLRRFLFSSNMSLEKTKQLIDLNYTLRSHAPEIFANRDPQSEEIKNIFDAIDYCPLPKLTEKKYKVFIYRLRDGDPEKFMYSDALKAFFMVADVRMSTDLEDSQGEVPIFDMAGTTLRHLTKITLPLMKKYMVYTQEAHPVRLREIHIINTAPFLDKCLALIRPFMKSEVAKLLHFHTPDSKTLFDYVPQNLIPEDYGGTLGVSMNTLKMEWLNKVIAHRDFYLDETRWKIIESKRSDKNNAGGNLFGMQGSFRSLTID